MLACHDSYMIQFPSYKMIADPIRSSCRVLIDMMIDAEVAVRQGSTRAFAIASKDPNFRAAVLNVRTYSQLPRTTL